MPQSQLPTCDTVIDALWEVWQESQDGAAVVDLGSGAIVRKTPAFQQFLNDSSPDDGPPQEIIVQAIIVQAIRETAAVAQAGRFCWAVLRKESEKPSRFGWTPLGEDSRLWLVMAPGANRPAPDIVTGIADRRTLEHDLNRRFHSGRPFSAVFVDLDGFKQVNDKLGHIQGDQALREIAQHIRQSLREADLVGRFGGDEFVVLVDGACEGPELEPVIARIREAVAQPLDSIPSGFSLSASIGWAVSTDGFASPAAMLAAADSQMYANKRSEA